MYPATINRPGGHGPGLKKTGGPQPFIDPYLCFHHYLELILYIIIHVTRKVLSKAQIKPVGASGKTSYNLIPNPKQTIASIKK